ncbi:ejaculatory bulb-specific protein 3-like [Schistocerca gregaria]|uniref:ejaculatory bulb-specific protein 3-like n=1 Tax=Schistocerca gregaria TaxID=7010 RepID=UPI00211EC764|nr:ejaculatory bulb-specific protein 3-like [Schistocerca gregaria]
MARILIACCLLSLAAVATHAAPQQDRLDKVDIDEVLGNERLFRAYVQCLLDDGDGKCTPEGKELKKLLPNLVATGCNDCSPRHLERSVKVLKYVTEKRPQDWTKLKAKYDPAGEYTKKHSATWKQRGINF